MIDFKKGFISSDDVFTLMDSGRFKVTTIETITSTDLGSYPLKLFAEATTREGFQNYLDRRVIGKITSVRGFVINGEDLLGNFSLGETSIRVNLWLDGDAVFNYDYAKNTLSKLFAKELEKRDKVETLISRAFSKVDTEEDWRGIVQPYPREWVPVYNANTYKCDMFAGPCTCGAWHSGPFDSFFRKSLGIDFLRAKGYNIRDE